MEIKGCAMGGETLERALAMPGAVMMVSPGTAVAIFEKHLECCLKVREMWTPLFRGVPLVSVGTIPDGVVIVGVVEAFGMLSERDSFEKMFSHPRRV